MPFKRLNGADESIDIDFGKQEFLQNYIKDGFLKEITEETK
jgi:hypothetical protein